MARSTEQQRLFEKFVEALEKYKNKTVDTAVLAEEVEKIYGSSLKATAAGKVSSLRTENPEIFKGITVTKITESSPHNLAWKNDPKFREFFKEKRPGLNWDKLDPFNSRFIKKNTYQSYLYEKAKAKTIPKNYISLNDFSKKTGISKDNLKEYRSNRKGIYGDLQKRFNDLFPVKRYKKEVFFKDPTDKKLELFKKEIKTIRDTGIKNMVEKKSSGSIEPIKAIHAELIRDVDATPQELAKAIYGNSDSQTLRMIGNDASKYTEVLTGSRKVPGLKAPNIAKTEEILGNILMPGSGYFNFGNTERRNALLRERDRIIKNEGPSLRSLRNALIKSAAGSRTSLDEAMGLSGTATRAPGYTELLQRIPQEINLLKGNTIDKDFSVLFEKVINGTEGSGIYRGAPYKNLEENIKLFNEHSKDFQKQYKVDTPLIEYQPGKKLDASNFIKNFSKLTIEAKANIKELADQGIALRSEAIPVAQMIQDSGDAKLIKRFESRINCAEGCLVRTASEQPGKFNKIYQSIMGVAKKGGRFGVTAAVGAVGAGLVKEFMNDDPSTYLSDENQQKNMLIDMITQPVLEPSMEPTTTAFGDAQLPAIGAVAAAGAIPGGAELYRQRIKSPDRRVANFATREDVPRVPRARVSPFRAALGPLSGVLGKGLATTGTPLGMLALEPLYIGQQIADGDSLGEVATNPLNYLGPAFAGSLSKEATRFAGPKMANIMRLGISPMALKTVSRRFGLPGLALSAGISGYEMYQNKKAGRGLFDDG